MPKQIQEHQPVAHRDHPNPRPIRDTAPEAAPSHQVFNLDPVPFQKTILEAIVFIGCMAAIGLLLIVGGAA